jgi:hypothetical protein
MILRITPLYTLRNSLSLNAGNLDRFPVLEVPKTSLISHDSFR